ncbi:MAG: C25 family cysteine peptidase [Rhodothermales bacterium]
MRGRYALAVSIALLAFGAMPARGQFDPGWMNPGQPYVKLGVVEDGIYRFSLADLAGAGVATGGIDTATLTLLENGRVVPLHEEGGVFYFAGRRNRGDDEAWAYDDEADTRRSSSFHSLYSDTTQYWLTWGGGPGRRYASIPPDRYAGGPENPATLRDTLHLEQDLVYYYGDSDDAAQPAYTRGEGYYWHTLAHTGTETVSQAYSLSLDGMTAGTDSVVVTVRLSGSSLPRHRVTLTLRTNGNPVGCATCEDEIDWNGYAFQTLRVAAPQSALAGAVSVLVSSHNEFNSVPNRVLVDWVRAAYTRARSARQTTWVSAASGRSNTTLAADGAGALLVLQPAGGHAFSLAASGGSFAFADSIDAPTRYWLAADGAAAVPAAIEPASPPDWADPANAADYILITTPSLAASAEALAAYRQTQDGFTTRVILQADLFDQFDYGRPTPIAIRRFLQATRAWATPPRFVVFWGDALRPEDGRARRPLQPWEVIPFGYSPSDGWFAMTGEGRSETLAVGRLPIRDNATGAFFVQKLARYESAPAGIWQKRLMLLVGGQNESEQNLLQNRALRWGDIAAGNPTAMDTLRFFKNASTPLDPSFQDSLSLAFKSGAAWLSYFGHSAADTWEIVTDDPETFDNADRLPIVLSMGCNTGNFAGGRFEVTDRLVFGERIVLSSMNGAIAHWGSSSASTISLPALLTNHVHEAVFQDTVRVLGTALQEAKRRFDVGSPGTNAVLDVLLQYGLIGDPATHIRIASQPDFVVTPDAISIDPISPVPADSALDVTVNVFNIGLVPADSVDLLLSQIRPDGAQVDVRRRVPPIALHDVLDFRIPIDTASVGTHRFSVTADPDNRYLEDDEANNRAEKTHTVFSTGLTLLDPFAYGVVRERQPRLRVALSRTGREEQTIRIELDTSPLFDSPALQSTSVATTGIVADWTPATPLDDGGTYYWRASLASDATAAWRMAAFTVDTAAPGYAWSQAGALFADAETDPFLVWDTDAGAWSISAFDVSVSASSERGNGIEKGQYVVNGERYEAVTLGFGMLVLDGATGALKYHNSFPTYRMSQELEDRFDTDSTRAVQRLGAAIADLDAGDYVFFRTRHLGNLSGPTLQPEVKALFAALGSAAIDTLSYNDLWIAFARAGFPEETVEWVEPAGAGFANEIVEDTTLTFLQPEGVAISPRIGPASRWETLEIDADVLDPSGSVRVDVLAEDETVLVADVPAGAPYALGAVDARTHPYLRLRATLADSTRRATPQLTQWRLFHTPAPELAVAPSGPVLSADTLAQAEQLTVTVPVVNLGPVPTSRAWITYTLTDNANRETVAGVDTLRVLEPDQPLIAQFALETERLSGVNRLAIRLEQDFTEPILLNNLLNATFVVRGDNAPPTFEVLVDDEALPNDPEPVRNLQDPALPFVSSQPTIQVTLRDENPFQPLDDTSYVRLQFDGRTVPFSSPNVDFQPATAEAGEARVFFTPDLSAADTTHTLVVRVFDASGNEAEDSPYQVHFRVQAAVEVESLYPYPNPMNTATTFAFRLRGADAALAEQFRIRIYTLTGRLIQEFDLIDDPSGLEDGALRIGWNKLHWDGRDADGDLIATGVYLYKVFARAEGRALEVNNKTGIEKLVVIR